MKVYTPRCVIIYLSMAFKTQEDISYAVTKALTELLFVISHTNDTVMNQEERLSISL